MTKKFLLLVALGLFGMIDVAVPALADDVAQSFPRFEAEIDIEARGGQWHPTSVHNVIMRAKRDQAA